MTSLSRADLAAVERLVADGEAAALREVDLAVAADRLAELAAAGPVTYRGSRLAPQTLLEAAERLRARARQRAGPGGLGRER